MERPSDDSNLFDRLAEEFAARVRRGEHPPLGEYIDGHPELADDIREVFPAIALMERLKPAPGEPGGPPAPRSPRAIPERLGDFRILRFVAEGGMGFVFEAEQESMSRRVALKVLKPGILDPKHLARFLRESTAPGRLHHTNIVPIFGIGESHGLHFYAMQFIRGESLDKVIDDLRWIRDHGGSDAPPGAERAAPGSTLAAISRSVSSGRFGLTEPAGLEGPADVGQFLLPTGPPQGPGAGAGPPSSGASRGTLDPTSQPLFFKSVARVGEQAARALAYAHRNGVLHRDIKPGNLLLDLQGTVWVADFGLAYEADAEDISRGDVVGTLRYIPPERFRNASLPQGDVYSLGLTLYELATLEPAFRGDDTPRLLHAVQHVPPRPPREIDRAVPRDLETIILKAVDKDPARRYASAEALADDLLAFHEGREIRARRAGPVERAWLWSRRNRAVALLLTALAVALVGGFASMALLWARAEQSADQARGLARTEADARARAQDQSRLANERAEDLAWQDYVSRVSRAYREVEDDNITLAEDLLHGCPPGRRGWEWHHVERLAHLDRFTLPAAGPSVESVAFSQDGTWLASAAGVASYNTVFSGAGDAEVAVWDVANGRKRRTLPGLPGVPHGLAIHPDGTRIVAASGTFGEATEGWLVAWDAATGRRCWSRSEPRLHAMSLAFQPRTGLLAVGYGLYVRTNANGLVKFWDVATGREARTLPGPRDGVQKLAFHPDGRRLAVTGSGVVDLWDLDAGVKLREFRGHDQWVYAVAFSPDGRWMATGGWDRTIKLWDLVAGVEALTLFGHKGFVLSLAFSPDGKSLVSTSEDHSAKLWEVPGGREVAVFHGHRDFVQCSAFRPDGRGFATGGVDGTIKLWDFGASHPVVFDRHHATVFRLGVRRDGRRVYSSDSGGIPPDYVMSRVWDPATGEEEEGLRGVRLENLGRDFIAGIEANTTTAVSGDGRLIAQAIGNPTRAASGVGGYGGSVALIRDSKSLRVLFTLAGHTTDIVCLGFSPDGRRLATASDDRTIKLWDTANGREVFTLRGHTGALRCLAFTPDGSKIISGSVDGTARVWDATPLPAAALQEHEERNRRKAETVERSGNIDDPASMIDANAAVGRWDQAAVAAARAVEREPDNLIHRWKLVVSLTLAGDADGVRRATADELRHFRGNTNPRTITSIVGHCTFAPDAVADPEAPVRLAEAALRIIPEAEWGYPLRTLGTALYRAGRFEEAIVRLEASAKALGGRSLNATGSLLAMTHHRLGHRDEARRWLDTAIAARPQDTTGFSTNFFFREAKSLILGDAEPTGDRGVQPAMTR